MPLYTRTRGDDSLPTGADGLVHYTRAVGPVPVATGTGREGSAEDAGSDTRTGAVLVTTSVGTKAGAIAKGSAGVTVSTSVLDASFLRSHGFPLPASADFYFPDFCFESGDLALSSPGG